MTATAPPPTKGTLGYEDLPRLMSYMTGDEKHSHAATSTLDVIWVLYDRVLRFDPRRPDWPERDRFLLSKGHGPMAFYAVPLVLTHLLEHHFGDRHGVAAVGAGDARSSARADRLREVDELLLDRVRLGDGNVAFDEHVVEQPLADSQAIFFAPVGGVERSTQNVLAGFDERRAASREVDRREGRGREHLHGSRGGIAGSRRGEARHGARCGPGARARRHDPARSRAQSADRRYE